MTKQLNHNAVLKNFFLADMDVHQALGQLREMPLADRWELARAVVDADPKAAVYYTQYSN